MKSFRDILAGVASKEGATPAPTLFDALPSSTKPQIEVQEAVVPGDGRDPTHPSNHSSDQHVSMRQHQEVNHHLQQALEHLSKAQNLAGVEIKPVNATHRDHVLDAMHTIGEGMASIHHACHHLSKANREMLK